jgi:hypothetical protein
MTVDRAAGLALVLIGLVALEQGRAYPLGTLQRPGPAFTPLLLALLLILFGGIVFAMGTRARRLVEVGWHEWRHVGAILVGCAFAAWSIERLGYRLTMALVLAVAGGSFFLFDTLLHVPLPRGPFGL